MEIKLLVRTHKKKFGSTLMFSHNISPREKKIMEDIRYTGYEPDDSQIVEVISSGHYVYFCTYIGGQDEYGRDYQNVIAAIFPFKLSDSDILNLRKTIRDIMKDIASEAFLEENRYFAEIKNRNTVPKNHSSNKNLKINYLKFTLMSLTVIFILFLSFFIIKKLFIHNNKNITQHSEIRKENLTTASSIADSDFSFINFEQLKTELQSAKTPVEKYEAYSKYIKLVENEAAQYKSQADDALFNEIKNLYNSNPKSKELLEKIGNYSKVYSFSLHLSEIESLKTSANSNIEEPKPAGITIGEIYSKVDLYNRNISSSSLKSLIRICKSALESASNSDKEKIKKILYQANLVSKSINGEIEIYITNKSSVFNRKTFSFEISVDGDDYQSRTKALNNDKDIYAGSFFVNISPVSTISFKIFDYSYDGKRHLLKDMKLDFDELNTQKIVADSNGNSFEIELKVVKDKFKIKK